MKIVHYDEVEDYQMSELTLNCFNHPYSKKHVENMIRADSRIPEWGGELYAVNNGKALGTVGILFPKLRTNKGVEKVGGIRNVCTRTSVSRKGVATKLLEEAHDRILENDVRFSFLMTSKSMVAYRLYEKLGYKDIHIYPEAFKNVEENKSQIEFRKEKDTEFVRDIYMKNVEGLTGLVEREKDYWGMAKARGWPDNDNLRIAYKDDKKIGYVLFEERRNQILCEEIASVSESSLKLILDGLESITDREFIVIKFVNPNHREILKEEGFNWYNDRWHRIMFKDFEEKYEEAFELLSKDSFHNSVYESY